MKTLEETIKHFKTNQKHHHSEYNEVAIHALEAWVNVIEADNINKVVEVVKDYVTEVRV